MKTIVIPRQKEFWLKGLTFIFSSEASYWYTANSDQRSFGLMWCYCDHYWVYHTSCGFVPPFYYFLCLHSWECFLMSRAFSKPLMRAVSFRMIFLNHWFPLRATNTYLLKFVLLKRKYIVSNWFFSYIDRLDSYELKTDSRVKTTLPSSVAIKENQE